MEGNVLHAGIVQMVSKEKITVVIQNASACASCHANGACLASDIKEKKIDIVHFSGLYTIGQPVNIVGHPSHGLNAAFYGYLLPFFMVVTTLLGSLYFLKDEALAGLLSLAALIPYYLLLYLFRDHIKRSFKFEISAVNN